MVEILVIGKLDYFFPWEVRAIEILQRRVKELRSALKMGVFDASWNAGLPVNQWRRIENGEIYLKSRYEAAAENLERRIVRIKCSIKEIRDRKRRLEKARLSNKTNEARRAKKLGSVRKRCDERIALWTKRIRMVENEIAGKVQPYLDKIEEIEAEARRRVARRRRTIKRLRGAAEKRMRSHWQKVREIRSETHKQLREVDPLIKDQRQEDLGRIAACEQRLEHSRKQLSARKRLLRSAADALNRHGAMIYGIAKSLNVAPSWLFGAGDWPTPTTLARGDTIVNDLPGQKHLFDAERILSDLDRKFADTYEDRQYEEVCDSLDEEELDDAVREREAAPMDAREQAGDGEEMGGEGEEAEEVFQEEPEEESQTTLNEEAGGPAGKPIKERQERFRRLAVDEMIREAEDWVYGKEGEEEVFVPNDSKRGCAVDGR